MTRPTFTSLESFTLETPYGTVRLQFESLKKCVVLLPDQHTEPPTSYVTIDGVSVEGSLVFELWGRCWELQRDDERTRCYNADTAAIRVSRELRNKLAEKLVSCLRQWVKANPDAKQMISKSLDRQALERFHAEIDQINAQIDVLVGQREVKWRVVHILRQRLNEETDT